MLRSGSALVAFLNFKSSERVASCEVCFHAPVKRWLCLAFGKQNSSPKCDTFRKLFIAESSECEERKLCPRQEISSMPHGLLSFFPFLWHKRPFRKHFQELFTFIVSICLPKSVRRKQFYDSPQLPLWKEYWAMLLARLFQPPRPKMVESFAFVKYF
jgi:hypothetical protein